MKKSLLGIAVGTALAATLALDAHAATYAYVSSDISNVQLWLGDMDAMTAEAQGTFTGLAFGGTAIDLDGDGYVDDANIYFGGLMNFTVNTINVRLTFNLYEGGFAPGSGIAFENGNVLIEVEDGSGWVPYGSIEASTTPIGFLANQPGAFPDQTTAGIVRDALPGLWDGQPGSEGFNRAAGTFELLGQHVGFFMEGQINAWVMDAPAIAFGPPEVPVPAAVWLFGSALMGLIATSRRRKASS